MATDNSLTIRRVFNLPASAVWKAWTDEKSCKKWWGPKDFTCPDCTIDFRVGGKFLSAMRSPEGKVFWSTGVYKEIVPNKKIVCTDSFSDQKGNIVPAASLGMPGDWPLECLVTMTLNEDEGKTTLELHHVGIPAEMQDDCKTGWQQSFDKLEESMK